MDIDWAASCEQVRAVKSLGDMPLIVLSASPKDPPRDVPTDVATKIEQAKQDMQKELAALSSNSKHVVASTSNHYIHYDEPQLVVDAILELVEAARSK